MPSSSKAREEKFPAILALPGASFGAVVADRCPGCGAQGVTYQYGNWHCGGYKSGCGWTTARDVNAPQGGSPLNGGMLTLEHCPRCGGQVIYNGNYFCEKWGRDCEWALPHPARKKEDKAIALRLTGTAE